MQNMKKGKRISGSRKFIPNNFSTIKGIPRQDNEDQTEPPRTSGPPGHRGTSSAGSGIRRLPGPKAPGLEDFGFQDLQVREDFKLRRFRSLNIPGCKDFGIGKSVKFFELLSPSNFEIFAS